MSTYAFLGFLHWVIIVMILQRLIAWIIVMFTAASK